MDFTPGRFPRSCQEKTITRGWIHDGYMAPPAGKGVGVCARNSGNRGCPPVPVSAIALDHHAECHHEKAHASRKLFCRRLHSWRIPPVGRSTTQQQRFRPKPRLSARATFMRLAAGYRTLPLACKTFVPPPTSAAGDPVRRAAKCPAPGPVGIMRNSVPARPVPSTAYNLHIHPLALFRCCKF